MKKNKKTSSPFKLSKLTPLAMLFMSSVAFADTATWTDLAYTSAGSQSLTVSENFGADAVKYLIEDTDVELAINTDKTDATAITFTMQKGAVLGGIRTSTTSSSGTIYGNVVYNIEGGDLQMGDESSNVNEAIIAGGYFGSTSTISGNTYINISGDDTQIGGTILGGGAGTVDGDTYITISGGTIYGKGSEYIDVYADGTLDGVSTRGSRGIFGGGSWGGTVTGNTYINITGGTIQTDIGGAGYTLASAIEGNTNVSVSGGSIYGDVTGGSLNDALGAGMVYGDATVSITGGTISARTTDTTTSYDGTDYGYVVNGDSAMLANSGSVYGMTGIAGGNVAVSVSGTSTSIAGSVYGVAKALKDGGTTVYYAIVKGDEIADTSDLIENVDYITIDGLSYEFTLGDIISDVTDLTENEDYVLLTYTNSYVDGKVTVSVADATIGGSVYGVSGASVGGDLAITVDSSATVSGNVYGMYSTTGDSYIGGDLTINVDGLDGNVYALYSTNGYVSTLEGSLNLTVSNTAFTGYDKYSAWTSIINGGVAIESDVNISLTDISVLRENLQNGTTEKEDGNLYVFYSYDGTNFAAYEDGVAVDGYDYSDFHISGDYTFSLTGTEDAGSVIDGALFIGGRVAVSNYASFVATDEFIGIEGDVSATLSGNVAIGGTSFSQDYGASLLMSAYGGNIGGNVSLTITDGSYGGAISAGPNTATYGTLDSDGNLVEGTGNISVNISGGSFGGTIYASSYYKATSAANADYQTALDDGTYYSGVVLGSTEVNITGGTFNSDIYVGATSFDSTSTTNILMGSATATLSGSTITFGESSITGLSGLSDEDSATLAAKGVSVSDLSASLASNQCYYYTYGGKTGYIYTQEQLEIMVDAMLNTTGTTYATATFEVQEIATQTIYAGEAEGGTTLNFDAYTADTVNFADFDDVNVYNASIVNAGALTTSKNTSIDISGVSSLTVDSLSVTSGTTTITAGVVTESTGDDDETIYTFTSDGSYFSSVDVNVSGGSTLNITGGDFSDYSLDTISAATNIFYVTGDSTLNLYNTTISGNTLISNNAGSVLNSASGSSVTITDSTISNNSVYAQLVYTSSSNSYSSAPVQLGGLLNAKDLTITDTDITGNYIDAIALTDGNGNASSSNYNLYGMISSSASTLVVSGGSISGNKLSVLTSNTSIDGTVYGGVTYTSATSTASFDGVTFDGNEAIAGSLVYGTVHYVSDGTTVNDVYDSDGTTLLSYGDLESTYLTVTNSTYINNVATSNNKARGGAIANYDSSMSISNSTFDNNSTVSAIIAEGGAIIAKNNKKSSVTTLTDVVFTNNSAEVTTTKDSTSGARGGAIFLSDGADMTYNVTSDITNYGNYASVNEVKYDANGGFLYFGDPVATTSEATFNVSEDATLTIGLADVDADNGVYDYAGDDSIASEDTTAVITKTGAGIMTVNSSMGYYLGTLNVLAGTLNINNDLSAGDINVDGATLNIADSNISNITSTTALITLANDATLTISDSTMTGNAVSGTSSGGTLSGAVISAVDSTVADGATEDGTTITISNLLFDDNKVSTSYHQYLHGGFMYLSGADVTATISGSTFSNNVYNTESTKTWIYGLIADVASDASLYVSDSTFSSNSVVVDYAIQGGIFSVYDSNGTTNPYLSISNSSFTENAITVNVIESITSSTSKDRFLRGGVINNYRGTLDLDTVTFSDNAISFTEYNSLGYVKAVEGGVLHAKYSDAVTTLTDVTFTNNSLSYTYNDADTTVDSISVARGGAIFLSDDAGMTYNVSEGTTITNSGNYIEITNYADSTSTKTDVYGGFLYFGDPITGSTATFNIAEGGELIIGDLENGAGYDSIASEGTSATITKTGTGTMTVNSSMAYYLGTLNIVSGTFAYNNDAGFNLLLLDIDAGATLSISVTTLSGSSITTLENDGTISLTGGELTSELSGLGDVDIAGTVVIGENGSLSSTTLDITSEGSLTANATSLTATDGITNAGDLTLTGGTLSSNINYVDGEYLTQGDLYITADVTASEGVYVATDTLTVSEDVKFDITADNLIVNTLVNEGDLVLDGNLDTEITGDGSIIVESNTELSTDDAGNLGNDVANSGTLTLTGGELASEVSGTGDVNATDTTISASVSATNVVLSSTEENSTSVGASVEANDIDITGTVVVSGDGSLTSGGTIDITSDGDLSASAEALTATSIANAGDLALSGDELKIEITGEGDVDLSVSTVSASVSASDIDITGSVVIGENGSLSSTTLDITSEGSLTANATSLTATDGITNAGDLTLTGGTLSSNINYVDGEYLTQGDLYITADVTASEGVYVATATLTVSEDVKFDITADYLMVDSLVNEGDLVLDGNLDTEITGDGSIIVQAETELSTDDAGNLGNDVANSGTLTLTGGELASEVSGTGDVNATDTTISASVSATNVVLSSTEENSTSVGASVEANDIDITGTVVVSGDGSLTSGGTIDITSDGDLSASAEALTATSIANAGDLALSGDELKIEITGEGDVDLSVSTVSASVSASDIDITGTVVIGENGSLTSTTLDITSEGSLTADLSSLNIDSLDNDGSLSITGNTSEEEGALATELSFDITGDGDVNVAGAVTLGDDISIEASNLNLTGELTASASDLDVDAITNTGTLNLTEGELTASINYDSESGVVSTNGTITIEGTVTAGDDIYVGADYLHIYAESSFEISTSNLSFKTITTDGDLSLDGDLDIDITGEGSVDLSSGDDEEDSSTISATVDVDGDINISGNVVVDDTEGTLSAGENIVVNEDSSLTSNADNLSAGEGIENEGTINLIGGTLTSSINQTTDESGNVTGGDSKGEVVVSNTTDGDKTYATEDQYAEAFTVTAGSTYAKSENVAEGETVTLYADEFILENGATYDFDKFSNVHVAGEDSSGIVFRVSKNGSGNILGDVVANSPITYSFIAGDDTLVVDATGIFNQSGDISTTGDAGNEYGILTIDSNITLNLDGTITTGYTYAVDAGETADAAAVVINENSVLNFVIDATRTDALLDNVGTVDNSGTISLDYATLETGDTIYLADDETIAANDGVENLYTTLDFDYNDLLIDTSAEGLTFSYMAEDYLSTEVATNANELVLAETLEAIDSSTTDYLADADSSTVKLAAAANGLDSFVMNASSYMAEVDTMLISNLAYANVNRARELMTKASGSYKHETIDDIDNDVSEVSAIEVPVAYSNLAQLQSINLLGSKKSSNGVAGYDYWSVGATANIDVVAEENLVAGVSIGGSYNKVEGDAGDNANSTAFLLNTYVAMNIEEYNFSLFANLGYAHFWNEGSNSLAKADWDSDALNLLVGLAHTIDTDVDGLNVNPIAMFNIVILDNGEASYSNGVDVDNEVYLSAKLMLGLEVEYAISAKFNAVVRAMFVEELGDKTYDMTYGFANGIASGIEYAGGEAGSSGAILGFSLSYDFSDTCIGYFNYNAYLYKHLTTHALNLSLGMKF